MDSRFSVSGPSSRAKGAKNRKEEWFLSASCSGELPPMHVPYLRVSDIGPVGPGGGRAAMREAQRKTSYGSKFEE
ncbi:hypothetical protein GCM10007921_43520 [Tritonibacter mobilis]|nr:hypothetical protein GCM10007921_43520 [Tritonibacter mobilis]